VSYEQDIDKGNPHWPYQANKKEKLLLDPNICTLAQADPPIKTYLS